MTKEKMTLKIMIEPKESPCLTCIKDCMVDEFMRCKKIIDSSKKIISKEYDYDEAVEIIAKVLAVTKEVAEAVLKALLEGGKNEKNK